MASRSRALLALALAASVGCTVHKTEAPPLSGPSELSLSLTMLATPDTLSQDGFSQSTVVIQARDGNAQPVRSLAVRVDIAIGGVVQDFGRLSTKNVVTGSDGKASVVYTAPTAVDSVDRQTLVSILATPAGSDATAQTPRSITIKLVPPGVITPPGPTVPDFTIAPDSPKQMDQVQFDASDPTLDARIASYDWTFGDGSSASGRQVSHQFRDAGSFVVTLTITDNTGARGTRPKTVQVGQTELPTPDFTFSPASPGIGEEIFFNAATSTAGDGRSIVSYSWEFGTGRTGSGVVVSKRYDTPGIYNVTLTIKDDAGNTASVSKSVTVGTSSAGGLNAAFTFSPSDPVVSTNITFNASTSTSAGDPITDYAWNFGDGSATVHKSTPLVSHAFGADRTYVVTLTVKDSKNRTSIATENVTVSLP